MAKRRVCDLMVSALLRMVPMESGLVTVPAANVPALHPESH